jgi:amino acid adenylation domain-containing protein
MQAMVVLLQPPPGAPELGAFAVGDESAVLRRGGIELRPYRLEERGAAFDVTLTMTEVDGELAGSLGYCTDLFDEAAARRMVGHLTALLASALAEPDRALDALPLLDGAERAAVLALGSGPERPYPDRTSLHALFAERAAAWPDATAVVAGERTLSYAELAERSDRLAAVLVREYGVGRGDRVGVYVPRGTDAIVAFWAALKAGGGYLPLAPDLPPRRLAWLIGDASPAVVLTHSSLAGRLPGDGTPRWCLDGEWPEADPVETGAGPEDLAYVIYTSGSTGRPKGVLLGHRGAGNLASALSAELHVTQGSRLLQLSSPAYDVHVADILVAHLHGAALHIPPPAATVPGPALVDLLAAERISHVIVSPSLLAALPEAELPELREILCGGEPLTAELVARWAPGRRFSNAYGPTEATVCVTWSECDPADRRRPPIGRPMPNGRIYVLDGRMEPVPVGVPGELWIGGVAVGQGYLGRPELTEERFRPDPFEEGGRVYRTGDQVRWLADGQLDFLTRLDDQVKIRGARVEPGEVAARLRELPGVRDAAVVVRRARDTDELVAYLVAAGPERLPVAELRGRLRAELPEPWLPAAFVHLDGLPLNRSGKLDRAALPAPSPADRGLTGRLAPRTELERVVAEVWAAALECSTVGVRDHFFDELGGSSLLVGRVTSELGRRLGRELPVTLLFEHPTVEALAGHLAAARPPAGEGLSPEEQADRRRRALSQRARR